MPSLVSLALLVAEISAFIQTVKAFSTRPSMLIKSKTISTLTPHFIDSFAYHLTSFIASTSALSLSLPLSVQFARSFLSALGA